ncbi:MAG: DUF3093 domain-containing protein [Nocardioidaceae bacterium]
MPAATGYDERLSVPLRWWALATMFWASLVIAFLVAVPVWVALAATGALGGLGAAALVGYGAARVTVRDGVLGAGPARIGVEHLGPATALDATGLRLLAGRDADARAFLLLRPYLARGVRVSVEDPADPTPYWLVSTRHPDRLVAALAHHAHPRGVGDALPSSGGTREGD